MLAPTDKDNRESTGIQVRALRSFIKRAMRTIDKQLDAKPQGGKPLMIVSGQDHSAPLHYLFETELIRELTTRGLKVACGLEQPSDQTEWFFRDYAKNQSVSPPLRAHGRPFHLMAMMTKIDRTFASHSSQARLKFLLMEEIPTALNDASRDPKNWLFLKSDDPQMRRALLGVYNDMRDLYGEIFPAGDIYASSMLGVAGRNYILADNAEAHIAALPPDLDVYINFVGNKHVAGHVACKPDEHHHPYNHSLVKIYRDRGYQSLGIPLQVKSDDLQLPQEALDAGHLVENCTLGGMTTDQGRIDDRIWVENAWPQMRPESTVHKDLDLFKRQCQAQTYQIYDEVLQAASVPDMGESTRFTPV
jgi:hypothetical protein